MIKPFSILDRFGLDLLVLVVLKYRRVQLASIDAVPKQQVGIQVKCPIPWMQLQMELFASNGKVVAPGTQTHL